MWYTPIGVFVTIIVGLLVSLVSGEFSDRVDPLTVAPFLRPWLVAREKSKANNKTGFAEHQAMLQVMFMNWTLPLVCDIRSIFCI